MNKILRSLKNFVQKNFVFSTQQKTKIENNIREIVEQDCNNTVKIDTLIEQESTQKIDSKKIKLKRLSSD